MRVHPTMVPLHHPLASVRDSFNAVFVEGGFVDSLMFYGRGAGGAPTASAVFGDVIDAAVNLRSGHPRLARCARAGHGPGRSTRPRPSTCSASTSPTGPACCTPSPACSPRHGVSIRVAEQEGNGPDARLVFITHAARESDVQATVRELRDLDVVRSVGGLLRVIGD